MRDAIYRSELAPLKVKIRIIALTTSLSEPMLTSVIPIQYAIHQHPGTAAARRDPIFSPTTIGDAAAPGWELLATKSALKCGQALESGITSVPTYLTRAGYNQADCEHSPNVENEYSNERLLYGSRNVLLWVLRLSHRDADELCPDICK